MSSGKSQFQIYLDSLRKSLLKHDSASDKKVENTDALVSKIEDIIYQDSGGGTEKENIFIIKQKFMLLASLIANKNNQLEEFDLVKFSKQNFTQNLIPPITVNLDEQLTSIPDIGLIIDDLSMSIKKLVKKDVLNHSKRLTARNIFFEYLKPQLSKDAEIIMNICKLLEESCFLYSLLIVKEYMPFEKITWEVQRDRVMNLNRMYEIKCKIILSSICNEKFNKTFLVNLLEEDFAKECAFKKRNELLPELEEFTKESLKSELSKFDSEDYKQFESDRPCVKCGNSYVKTVQLQLRSADEPMTTFFICMYPRCKFREKDGG